MLDVKPHSPLYFHGGYPQIVWDAEGKYVTSYGGYPDMAVADGAVVTTKSNGYSGSYYKGAHLGVDVPGSSYAFDCTSSYETSTPDVWSCKDGKKLYKTNDDYCGVQSQVTPWASVAGWYRVRVRGYSSGSSGYFWMSYRML